MLEIRGFTGKLNLDDNPYRIPKGDHTDALNMTRDAQGTGQDEAASNIVGNKIAIYFNVTDESVFNSPTPTQNTLTFFFFGNPFPNTVIEIYLFNGSTNVLITNYTTQPYDTISDVLLGLAANTLISTGVSIGYSANTFYIIYNNSVYSNYSYTVLPLYSSQNKVIGNYADKVRNREYFFIWNNLGYNKICYYDAADQQVYLVMEDKTYTNNVNVLNFDPSYRINHIDIVYRDEDGDLLFWTDGLNPPSKINVKTATTNGYGIILRSYLDVAKEPPSTPPYCVYEDNLNVTVNNLNNKQFKFKYRYVYDDLEKSVTSAQSEVPIPKNYSNQSVATDPTKNSSIFLLMDSGPANVTKIEILASESLGVSWSDFFLVKVLDKSELNIFSNNTAQFKFFNDQSYGTIPLNESIQPFDLVPQKAYTQSLPNGNVLDYGAITEGYDLVIPEYELTSLQNNLLSSNIGPSALVVLYGISQPVIALKVIVKGNPSIGDVYYINYTSNGTSISFSITSSTNTTAGLRFQISSYFSGVGYSVSIDSDFNLIVIDGGGAILNAGLPTRIDAAQVLQSKDSAFVYDWFSRYSYGVVYFDEKGRTNGVVSPIQTVFQTQQYDELNSTLAQPVYIPEQELKIYNRPPLWSSYFEIVRTKNLNKSNFLYWVSYRTYKDAIPNQLGNQYAYISISNLTGYLIDNPNIKTISYEFAPGDRIRFIKLYNGLGDTIQKYGYLDNRDYQIVESVIDPTINTEVVTGQVIKILLPTLSPGVFDFGGDTYANYLIELYTPSSSTQNNVYYEFGQKYNIGNTGATNNYHLGMIQNQTDNLSQPAIFNLHNGDSFFRYRTFPREGTFRWKSEAFTGNNPIHLNSLLYSNTNTNTNLSPEQTINLQISGSPFSGIAHAVNIVTPNVFNFFIKGSITVVPSVNLTTIALFASTNFNINPTSNFQYFYTGPLVAGVETTITYSIQITNLVGDNKLTHGLSNPPFNTAFFQGTIKGWIFEISINNSITQGIIDPNFSDFYDSSASPNGRPWVFDPNAAQEFNPTLIRFGGEYQFGTTVNNINRFYEENFDLYDRSRGSIKKMFIEGRNQYVFQQFDVGVVTVLTQIVRDTAGNPLSAQSDNLLNKIVYPYIGGYGIGDVPESFAYGKHSKYFVDSNKGVVCRLSSDGITPLSITYKTNAFFVAKLAGFQNNLNTTIPETGTPTVYGAFDAYTNKYIIAMDAIDRGEFQQQAYTISFLESRDNKEGFESFLSFHPENMGALNNLLITFKDGQIWLHNNDTHCNFYGVQYDAYIETAFNESPLEKKTFTAIMETANTVWYCPSIVSQLNTYGSTPQQSNIVEARFGLLEGQYYSAILRDQNSPGGIINGDTMKGNYLIVKFQKDAAANFYYLNSVSLNYINSPLNTR